MTNFLEVLGFIFLSVSVIILFYSIYQLFRNEKVYKIRIKWIDNDKWEVHKKYSYDDMMCANKKNWYGLKWPNENDYK